MKAEDYTLCETVFSSGTEIGQLSLVKIMREGHLLLALPLDRSVAVATLALYEPQKWKGKLLLSMLKLLVWLGLYRILPKFSLKLGDSGLYSEIKNPTRSGSIGFLLGNANSVTRNLIAVYKAVEGLSVIKAGCGDSSAVVRNEYQAMKTFDDLVVGVPKCRALYNFDNGVAYSMEYIKGRSPRSASDDDLVFEILKGWGSIGQRRAVHDLDCWRALFALVGDDLKEELAELSCSEVTSPVLHGDFAPWNVKINSEGGVKILDWEYAESFGMPGWDWLHYHVQRLKLIERTSAEKILAHCEELLRNAPFSDYLLAAGLNGHENALLGSYLYYSGLCQSFPREKEIRCWITSNRKSTNE